jgi:hypothetical protein
VSNRKISEFPAINGVDLDEQDLLTLVHVFEVDPTLRNKKITFTQFKEYLNEYYAPTSDATFSGIVVQNNAIVSGTISGATGTFTDITGSTLRVTTPSGVTPAIVCSGIVSGSTNGFVIQGPLIILS